eukprot:m.713094 g.713094  ORF g.713094 m.713094 type:complete len:368 (-) comp22969_c0_seq7:2142-3245(-)
MEQVLVNSVGELFAVLSKLSEPTASQSSPFVILRDRCAWDACGLSGILGLDDELMLKNASIVDTPTPTPKLESMQLVAQQLKDSKASVIVAIGGGTAIDIAKGAAWLSSGGTLSTKPQVETQLPKIVAVPTTAGTGSEATHFAVCWDGNRKHSLADVRLRPAYAIVDASLQKYTPASITATSGLDALCQCLESLWSQNATEESRKYGTEGAQLALQHLKTAVTAPTPEARAAMSRAAYLSGCAINITKTTTAHALSYAITHDYKVPHGFAVALTCPQCLELRVQRGVNGGVTPVGTDSVCELIGGDNPVAKFRALVAACGGPTRLRDVGVGEADLPALATRVNTERLRNDTLSPTSDDLVAILQASY